MDIKCIFCHAQNPEDAYFCNSCENSLIVGKMTSNGTGIITRGFTWELRPRDHSLGRNMTNDFVIPSNQVAGTHLKLLFSDDCFYINNESAQGNVFVNSAPIVGVTPLPENCILQVGKEEFRYSFSLPEGTSMEELERTQHGTPIPPPAPPKEEEEDTAGQVASQLQLLLGIISEISNADSLQAALDHAVDSVLRLSRTKRGYCFLVEETAEGTMELHEVAARQSGGKPLPEDGAGEYTISQSMLTQVLAGNGSVMIEDAMNQKIDTNTIRKFKLKSIVCLPLMKRGPDGNANVMGVVYADSVMPTGELPEHSKSTLQMLTEILSSTILRWQELERARGKVAKIEPVLEEAEKQALAAYTELEVLRESATESTDELASISGKVSAIYQSVRSMKTGH
jgi:hypothetical protein